MAKSTFLLAASAALFLSACSKKDPAPISNAQSALSVTVTSDFLAKVAADSADFWLFATDKSGQVLDAHQITSSGPYDFVSSTSDDSISLTQFSAYSNASSPYFICSSFLFKRQSAITFDAAFRRAPAAPEISGTATISITNFQLATYPNFSWVLVSDGYSGILWNGLHAGTNSVTMNLRGDTTSLLITAHTASNQPVYTWARHVQNGANVTVDFSAFLPFPETFSAPDYTTQLNINLAGFYDRQNKGTGYLMASTFFDGGVSPGLHPLTGFMSGFDSYQMSVSNGPCTYSKKGAINTAFTIPARHVSVLNGNFQSPSFSSDGAFTYRRHTWYASLTSANDFMWNLYAAKGSLPKTAALPSAILVKYPTLDLTKLVYFSSSYTDNLDGYTYEQYLNDLLSGTIRKNYEFYSYY